MTRDYHRQSAPVHLSEPASPVVPVPIRGCDVCTALKGQWDSASEAGGPAYDPSHALDLAIEIGRHPHDRVKRH
jgi:hypothetical protein